MESSIKLKENVNQSQHQLCNGSTSSSIAIATTTTATGVGIGAASGVTPSICSSDSFSSMLPPTAAAAAAAAAATLQRDHELVSANSIELNAAASLSDDSGVPLTTNSSISSGDSYRIGMCKFEIEMVESDGEVSQFDSLDNCSEGGMSAENFNTLKKGPLAPIDPPPEFQDSPQTTLVRSISKNIVNSLRRWTSSQSSFEHLKDDVTMVSAAVSGGAASSQELVLLLAKSSGQERGSEMVNNSSNISSSNTTTMMLMTQPQGGNGNGSNNSSSVATTQLLCGAERTLKESYAINKHLYSSDSILNSHTDNIYDEPNNIISSSLGNSIDLLDEDDDDDEEEEEEDEAEASEQSSCSPSLPSPPPPVSIIKIKQTLCPYYQDHTRYFKAIPTEQDNIASAKAAAAQQRFNSAGLSEIHDYDLYYGARSRQSQQQQQPQQQQQQTDNSSSLQRRQLLYSPLGHTSHCHYHSHYSHQYAHPHQHYGHAHHHHQHHHGQRPNSRNSLNSRLSSSHNSLNVSSANKPDDSIFITQAMSHDALFTREISDFYNVPIDSDIYAFPVDMIEQQQQQQQLLEKQKLEQQQQQQQQLEKQQLELSVSGKQPAYHKAASRRNKRNKRKQRYAAATTTATETSDDGGGGGGGGGGGSGGGKHGKYRTPVTQSESEPLHMTLDEVKQFYHTLYSDAGKSSWCSGSGGGAAAAPAGGKAKGGMGVKSSNETIWSVSTNTTNTTNTTTTTARTRSSIGTTRTTSGAGGGGGGASSGESSAKYLSKQNKHNIDNDKLNNNNNNNINSINNSSSGNNYAQQQQQQQQIQQTPAALAPTSSSNKLLATNEQQQQLQLQQTNNKHVLHTEKKSQFSLNLKQKFCSIFRFRRSNHNRCRANNAASAATATAASAATTAAAAASTAAASSSAGSLTTPASCVANATEADEQRNETNADLRKKFQSRALPPLPKKAYAIDAAETETEDPKKSNVAQEPRALQFTSSIEKVKDYGWYWGPLSSEAAEKVLSNEPDGSFIVRDSSDDHYIFSLSFKLNNCVRHVRIEQDQGTFSFGSYAKFKSQTITEFIEKAVEHSRSGRYLFFLHRRPEHGPMRVQLTNPVSRFKHVQSLQHMCRFVILKAVIRKDLIQTLPLPRRLLDYLNYKHCYSEQVESDSSHSQISGDGSM